MPLASAINEYAAAEAAAKDWSAVSVIMTAISTRATPRLCYAVESGQAVAEAGGDPTALLQSMLGDPNGIMLFQKLSSSAGVMWSHPATVPYLQGLVDAGAMSQQVMTALVELSAPVSYPFATVTAEQCETAWESQRLASDWAALQNDGGINVAVAAGDRAALIDALIAAAGSL